MELTGRERNFISTQMSNSKKVGIVSFISALAMVLPIVIAFNMDASGKFGYVVAVICLSLLTWGQYFTRTIIIKQHQRIAELEGKQSKP